MPIRPLGHRLRTLEPRIKVHRSPSSSSTLHLRLTGRALQKRNARILARYPVCPICEAAGMVTVSTQVDHRLPLVDGGSDDAPNLWGLCGDCHTTKTAAEASRRAQGLVGEVPGLPPMKAARPPLVA